MIRAKPTTIRRAIGVALSIWVIAPVLAALPGEAHAAPGATEVREALEGAGTLETGGLKLNRDALTVAYRARDFEPVWTAPEMGDALQAALRAGERDGLDPESFEASALKSALAGPALTPVGRELLLSDRFLAYARVMAQGRVSASGHDM